MTRPSLPMLVLAPSLALLATFLPAQEERVAAKARMVPAAAAPGQEVILEVEARIQDGYHIYGAMQGDTPTRLEIDAKGLLEAVGTAVVPAGAAHDTFGIESFWVEGTAHLKQRFKVPAGAAEGAVRVAGRISYMACTPDFCEPPAEASFEATLTIEGTAPARPGEPAKADAPPDPPQGGAGGAVEPPGLDLGLQGLGSDEKVSFAARFEPATARAGERVELVVEVTVEPGWHVYGQKDENPIGLEVTEPGTLVPKGEVALPDGERHEIAKDFVNYWLTGKFEMSQPLDVPAGTKPGGLEVSAVVRYLPCDENQCLAPGEALVTAKLEIEAGPARAAHVADGAEEGGTAGGPAEMGLIELILAAIGAGLLALVMPCTYPMIPITFSFFTKQADQRGGKVLPLALAYGAGIVLVFVVIGVAAGPIIVPFAAHWITNLVIATLFVVFAFALFGIIDLQPPRFLLNLAGQASTHGGYLGVFLMGTTLVVASFTCTVPFVGTMLSISAKGGTGQVILGMAVFGLTMALPFVYLSLLPGKVKSLPRSGEWMHVLKVFLGFVELAAAFKFISNVDLVWDAKALPRELFLVLWAGLFFVAGLFLLGAFRLKDESAAGITPGRMTGALAVIMFSFYCLYGALGFRLDYVMTAMAPPYSAPLVISTSGRLGGERAPSHQIVVDDYEAAVALAEKERKLLMVNFTGVT